MQPIILSLVTFQIFIQSFLYIYKNQQVLDSLLVYSIKNYSVALVQENRFYCLTNDNVIILNTESDESGDHVKGYLVYKINLEKGIFTKLKNRSLNLNFDIKYPNNETQLTDSTKNEELARASN